MICVIFEIYVIIFTIDIDKSFQKYLMNAVYTHHRDL
jgi:hypothetical protein